MKFTKSLLITGLLLSFSQSALAASTDSKTIDLKSTVPEYIQLIGTSVNGTEKLINAVNNTAGDATVTEEVSLGTLGIHSNIPGSCTISFATTNGFKLMKGATTLTTYEFSYGGESIKSSADIVPNLGCKTTDPTNLQYKPKAATAGLAEAGDYTDTVTVTVTGP